MNNKEYLRNKCFDGLEKRGLIEDFEYIKRLNYELSIIFSGDLQDFFLITAFIVCKLKNQGIQVGLGRGSAAGSLVCFCLRITEINPIEHQLIFERFLNPTRVASINNPDIDIDISRDKRQMVLKQIKKDFGEKNTYQVINKLFWTTKTAIKDLGRIIGLDFQAVNKITGLITDEENLPYEVISFLNANQFIKDNYENLKGLIKTYGVHAGANIILPNSVENYASVLKINGVECLDIDGKTCDSLSILKQDMLGLNNLTIIADTLKLNPHIKLPTTYDDECVYDTINKSTLGIFQFEGAGVADTCQQINPQTFEELTDVTALARPGSKDSHDTEHYIARKFGKEPIEYDHPLLKPILEATYGCIVYQEQAMRIVTDFAGMSAADAEIIRRGIGKKIKAIFDEYYPKFIQSCVDKGISQDIAEAVFKKMEASASYSFNKAHAVSYTALTYITGYLKTYYPIEFYIALLNNTDNEDKRMQIYNEMKNSGYLIHNPDINISKDTIVSTNDNNVYLSFNLIKGVGEKAVESIISNQPYYNFNDFLERKDSRKVNKKVVKALIKAGAFDSFNPDRGHLMHLFDETENEHWTEEEKLFNEFSVLSLNPKKNLLSCYEINATEPILSLSEIKDVEEGIYFVKTMISSLKIKTNYAFLSVTDNIANESLYVSQGGVTRYLDTLQSVGEPVLLKIKKEGPRLSLISLIELKNMNKYSSEYSLFTGNTHKILQNLQKDNPNYNIGITKNASSFVSKKGNNCVSFDLYMNEKDILHSQLICGYESFDILDGSILFFNKTDMNMPFLDVIQIVQI